MSQLTQMKLILYLIFFTVMSNHSGIILSSSPKLGHNSSTDDLAEAASKITLLSPAKLKGPAYIQIILHILFVPK